MGQLKGQGKRLCYPVEYKQAFIKDITTKQTMNAFDTDACLNDGKCQEVPYAS